MSAGSLRVATYMQEHPDDAAEIRDELKFWNEVMDHQVPMTKERAEATLPFLTALKWGPLFTNTSPIMFCPPGLDPLDVRCSFPTAEPSSHLHAARTADEHRPGQPANLVRPDPNPAFSLAQPCPPLNSLVFPIRHWLLSPTDTAWAPRPNMTLPKPLPTPTDVKTDYSKPLCPTISHLPGARVPVPYSIHAIPNIDRGHGMAKKLAIYNHVVDLTLKPPTAHRNHHSLSTSRSPTPSGLLLLVDIAAVSAHKKLRPIQLVAPGRPPCKPIYRTRRQ
ncbi:hypothetical protein AaE_012286 [Aphanomyces astaci]|uniref:Uncharacterized protein n=1 Tax=Aphanomyces astaci TaxID=112090 RepID=A0A6A4ZHP2_APHAT|nr:hypothetical protein AaE_012286 [Aphanomyces astaci]